ncbi:hypothetical protein [Halobaculum sp. D14]|uniref:hypothetical protein n=1 Tax=Halobaculum sp. D14 TaxID=3421642 RepID=UPI003EBB0810
MVVEREKVAYAGSAILIIAGGVLYVTGAPAAITLLSFLFSVGSGVFGWRKQREVKTLESAMDSLLEEKKGLKEELEATEERKQLKSQRLRNLKQVLDREGIDADYLIEKYGQPLKAPLLVLTHFNSDKGWNTEEGEQYIRNRLEELDAKVLHGATRVIPPRSVDQEIETREELEDWFHDEVLGGRDDLTYKLELMSIVDLRQVFGQDRAGDDGGQFEMNTIDELFDTDPVVPTDDLLDILARSDRISMEDELRENVALLAIPYASESQMRDIIQHQPSIQSNLGDITQIGNTDIERIEQVLEEHDVQGAEELATGIQEEARSLRPILDGELSETQEDIATERATELTGT